MAQNRRNSLPYTGYPDKGRAIKLLVVCITWNLEPLDLLDGLAQGGSLRYESDEQKVKKKVR